MAGLVAELREMKNLFFGPPPVKGVIQDLECAMRIKGGLTPEDEKELGLCKLLPACGFVLGSGLRIFVGWFGFDKVNKLLGLPPNPQFIRFLAACGCAYFIGKGWARDTMHHCPAALLNKGEGRMKMELANIWWHPRHSYIDSTFVERMKEFEATSSNDVAGSISRETNMNSTTFGDLMEDSLACILGSPGCNMESNNTPEKAGTVLKRSELRARRRGRQHHHRHC